MTAHEGLNWQRAYFAERKRANKLQERINRVAKLVPGNQRIWYFDKVAMSLSVDAELSREAGVMDVAADLEEQVLFVRRFAWDMGELRDVVRGNPRKKVDRVDYEAGKYDPDNWKGPRP